MIEIKSLPRNNTITKGIKGKPVKIKTEIRRALYDIGNDLKNDAIKAIKELPKHGRTYLTREGRGKWKGRYPSYTFERKYLQRGRKKYTASAPGEAPAIVTGKLLGSIGYSVIGNDRLIFASFGVNYAKYLEYKDLKTQRETYKRPAPRPYLSSAYNKNRFRIFSKLADAFAKGAK